MNDQLEFENIKFSLEEAVAQGFMEKVGTDSYRLTSAGLEHVETLKRKSVTFWVMEAQMMMSGQLASLAPRRREALERLFMDILKEMDRLHLLLQDHRIDPVTGTKKDE